MREVHYLFSFRDRNTCLESSWRVGLITLSSWFSLKALCGLASVDFSWKSNRGYRLRGKKRKNVCVRVWEREREKHRKARADRAFLDRSTVLRALRSVGFQSGTRRQPERALYVKERGIPITRDKCRIVLESVERTGRLSTDSPTWR